MKAAMLAGVALFAFGATTVSTLAADLPARMPAPAPVMAPPPYSWSGFYIGGHVGWGTARKDWFQTAAVAFNTNTASYDADGFLGGGQVGFNWQTGAFVFGVEVDASWTDFSGNSTQTLTPTWRSFTDFNWIGTATGRVGYAWDRVLLYAKGGFAWADEDHSQSFNGTNVSTISNTHTGWVAGAGIEVALWDNWTGKAEYNYINLGRENLLFTNAPPAPGVRATDNWDIEQQIHVVKFGLNYRINWGR
jgi:outer membrane immunogenic protein